MATSTLSWTLCSSLQVAASRRLQALVFVALFACAFDSTPHTLTLAATRCAVLCCGVVCCAVQWFLELPYLGIPGIVRFIDVRTQWFDDSVKAAMRDGIKQVRA
jgi:hypothetical protein